MTFKKRFFGSSTGDSPVATLNVTDWKKIGRGAAYAAGGTVCAYLLTLLPGFDFGKFSPYSGLIITLASTLLNAAIKFFNGGQ